ncbi:MAG TPA: hypothetical protein VGH54_15750 [Mycobacterium sp.]|jgi:hypothetical protein|uniref:hypothetical protein n=1 Tax=Mycobacterium sp. TaxID=1785 RepID=UPI002F3EC3CC
MTATLGNISNYTLTEDDATEINNAPRDHVMHEVAAGDQFPMITTRVQDDGSYSGTVFLDNAQGKTLWREVASDPAETPAAETPATDESGDHASDPVA